LAPRKFRVMGSSYKILSYLPDCINFSAEPNVKHEIQHYKKQQVNEMIDRMRKGTFSGRVAAKSDLMASWL